MKDERKTKAQLVDELTALRRRVAELERKKGPREDAEQRQTRRDLQRSKDRLELAEKIGNIGSWSWEIAPDRAEWSAQVYRIFKAPREDASYQFARRFVHPDDLALWESTVRRAVERQEPFALDYRAVRSDGETIWVHNETRIVFDENGKFTGYEGTVQDITDRKLIEEVLRESREELRQLFESMPSGVAIYEARGDGADFTFRGFNAAAERIEGVPRQQVLGRTVREVFPGVEAFGFLEVLRRVWRTGRPEFFPTAKYQDERDPGSWRENWVYKLPSGLIVAIYRDVTDRVRADEALRESEERYRRIVEGALDGITIFDRSGRILEANDAYCRMIGYSENELRGATWMDIDAVETPAETREHIERVISKGWDRFETRHRRKDGAILDREVSVRTLSPVEGTLVNFIRDVTDRKRMEEEIRRAHNLEALGQLAGGIAHDFNNVLTGVVGNLSLLEVTLDRESEAYALVREASEGAARTRGLAQQLMTFARGGLPVKETASIDTLIRETAELSLRGSATRPEYHFSEDLLSVEVDPGQIGQLVQNLVLNADQAMPNGGTLHISAQNVEITGADAVPLEPGSYVRVKVEDEGVGIPERMLHQVFDPYFTTKSSGHGLGLSICHSIVKRHGGHITVESVAGERTAFTFYLPASRAPAAAREVERKLPTGTGRILVMDDEDSVRRTVERLLTRLGYRVTCVEDGAKALEAYRRASESGEPFRVVIMDLTVPGGMGGKDAVVELRGIDPEARVIVASGYANDPVLADPPAFGFTAGIRKPISLKDLAEVIALAMRGDC